ncbi:MAG: hypothetical protein ACW99A_07390 [Candidatus Kariarchaeaceae archaeon]|jgi:hypothetical protein
MVDLDKDITQPNYQDMVTYKPAIILDINPEQRYLINQYYQIIEGLRKGNLTVKEIHQLYWEPRENKPTKTLKTIYRYLDILEESGVVAVAGQRMTIGSRITEKVYCLTAEYFHDSELELNFWDKEESEGFAKKVGILLSEVLDNEHFKEDESSKVIQDLLQLQSNLEYFNILEIIEKIRNSPDLRKSLESSNFDEHTLISFTSQILVLVRNIELIAKVMDINDKKLGPVFTIN